MDTEISAVALVRYLQCNVVSSNNRPIEAHISNIKELNKDMSMFNLEPCSKTILKALQFNRLGKRAQKNSSQPINIATSLNDFPEETSTPFTFDKSEEIDDAPSCVLRVTVEQMVFPVTIDILHQVFSRTGKVQKIKMLIKSAKVQALIQYANTISAKVAKFSINGQHIYNGCGKIEIEYSKLSNLCVRKNSHTSRDYTKPDSHES